MQLPSPVTPAELLAELSKRGIQVSDRTLKDRRDNGLLPQLRERGKGQRQGKKYYWRSPKLLEQAIFVDELMKLNVPNDEARLIIAHVGFPVQAVKLSDAWVSCLGKLRVRLNSAKKGIVGQRGSEFDDIEDELSALTEKFVCPFATEFGFDHAQSAQLIIYLFGTAFRQGYFPEADFFQVLADFAAQTNTLPMAGNELILLKRFNVITNFIQGNVSFFAVNSAIADASKRDFNYALRRWRRIVKSVHIVFPQLAQTQVRKILVAGFGRVIFPIILRFISGGKVQEIDDSIALFHELIADEQFARIIGRTARFGKLEKSDLTVLGQILAEPLRRLGKIWGEHGFPFDGIQEN